MPNNRKPLIYGAFPVCRNYTVRAQLRQFAAGQWRPPQAHSGVVGAQRLYHHGEHLRPLGLQVQDHLGTGNGDRACPAGGRRLQQPLGVDRCRGELLIFSPENRRSCRLILWAKIKKPVIGVITGFLWRRVRDSNPRDLSVYSISSAAPSTTRTTLRVYFRPVFFPEICSKIRWRENRRDGKKYSILRFSVLRNIKENQGDEIPSFCRNFESAPL